VDWSTDGIFGDRTNAAAASENKSNWFGGANAGTIMPHEGPKPDNVKAGDGDGLTQENSFQEEYERIETDPNLSDHDDGKELEPLESYYEKTAKEKIQEAQAQADNESTDSEEEEEEQKFQEAMNDTWEAFKRSIAAESTSKKQERPVDGDRKEEGYETAKNVRAEYMEKMRGFERACEKEINHNSDHASKDKQKSQSSDAGGKKKHHRRPQHDVSDDFERTDKKFIDEKYDQKVATLLAERIKAAKGTKAELHEYRENMRDRFVKLGGDDDRDMVPHFTDNTEAVKYCVKKYNEECEKIGIFKAFSSDDQTSDGIDARQRANLAANIKRLSEDIDDQNTYGRHAADRRAETPIVKKIPAQAGGVMELIK